ncbi:c-type cytochrome [Pseudohongiella sp.]|uniref:Cytochrome c domain-containing protein n=1 Tax=marine sediment metagenome TaxID=412755 RepID=A0A0F9VNX8_9ZZZZ|nr:c-type cytochrome [Pseudohongiella sp.]HDZ09997.1 c-type cytochrome [Pseudohongiella sp.]HEA63893.1 c-type cytochrome [Pseudohongiella sp.]
MKNLVLPVLALVFAVVIFDIAYSELDIKSRPSVHTCSGECYQDYVAANGTIVDQQRAAAEAAALASPAELGRQAYASCQACHGAGGEGGIGPQLQGRDAAFITQALTAYKNGETRGARSNIMWPSAESLSARDIENLAAFVETL